MMSPRRIRERKAMLKAWGLAQPDIATRMAAERISRTPVMGRQARLVLAAWKAANRTGYQRIYPHIVIAAGHVKGWNTSRLLDSGSEGAIVITLADELADELKRRGQSVSIVPHGLDLSAEIAWVQAHAPAGALAVEMHTNGPGGRGLLTIYSPWSAASRKAASRISKAVSASRAMPLYGTGLLSSSVVAGWHGWRDIGWTRALRAAGYVPVMPECGFHSDPKDAAILNDAASRRRLVVALADGIAPPL